MLMLVKSVFWVSALNTQTDFQAWYGGKMRIPSRPACPFYKKTLAQRFNI